MHRIAVALVVTGLMLATTPAAAGGRGGGHGGGGGREHREERREERRDEQREHAEERHEDADAKPKTATPKVDRRQRRQASRIVGGVKGGQLTKAEMDALTSREQALRDLEAGMKADGQVTKEERAKLHDELDALGQAIRDEKHDAEASEPIALHPKDAEDRAACKAKAGSARRLAEVRRTLNRTDLPAAQRAALEAEHDRLLDELYEEATEP